MPGSRRELLAVVLFDLLLAASTAEKYVRTRSYPPDPLRRCEDKCNDGEEPFVESCIYYCETAESNFKYFRGYYKDFTRCKATTNRYRGKTERVPGFCEQGYCIDMYSFEVPFPDNCSYQNTGAPEHANHATGSPLTLVPQNEEACKGKEEEHVGDTDYTTGPPLTLRPQKEETDEGNEEGEERDTLQITTPKAPGTLRTTLPKETESEEQADFESNMPVYEHFCDDYI
ncbi:uncharacterized protein LOC135385143 [Ornithodoros turicata]